VIFLNKNIKTIIDIGGQDTKIIKISEHGKVLDFIMNDKCAAGTGRFLEKVADFFKIDIREMSEIARLSSEKISINSTCVVFTESEIIGLIASGVKKEDIVNAVHYSVAHRVLSMSGQIMIERPVAFVGGVAKNNSVAEALSDCLETEVFIPPIPDITGAVGAALYREKAKR
jgi:predicted CoA-substrate-specific enzyme activase